MKTDQEIETEIAKLHRLKRVAQAFRVAAISAQIEALRWARGEGVVAPSVAWDFLPRKGAK